MAVSIQNFGIQLIPVYPTSASLAADQYNFVPGQLAVIQSTGTIVVASQQLPAGGYVTTSTGLNGLVTYWAATLNSGAYGGPPDTCRAVCSATTVGVAPFHAYSGSGTGTLTSTANQAFPAQDGVAVGAGDTVFIMAGLTGVTAVDTGPWVIVNAGSGSAKWVLQRPYWFSTGSVCPIGMQIHIGPEGSVYNGTTWVATAAQGTVIDTTDCAFYCRSITFQVTLVAGVQILGTSSAATNQPTPAADFPLTGSTAGHFGIPIDILSATQSDVVCVLATKGGTITTTVGYAAGATAAQSALCTAGYARTSIVEILSVVSVAVQNSSDTSTVQVQISNPV